jgi:hypothetical protein
MWWLLWMRGLPHEVILAPGLDLPGLSMQQRYKRKRVRRIGGDGYSWTVPLGSPIVDVTLDVLVDGNTRDRVRKTIDRWLALDRQNIYHRKFGTPYTVEFIDWEANTPPAGPPKEWSFAHPQVDRNVVEILGAMRPGLTGLAFNLNMQRQFAKTKALKSIVGLLKSYKLRDEKLERFLKAASKQRK